MIIQLFTYTIFGFWACWRLLEVRNSTFSDFDEISFNWKIFHPTLWFHTVFFIIFWFWPLPHLLKTLNKKWGYQFFQIFYHLVVEYILCRKLNFLSQKQLKMSCWAAHWAAIFVFLQKQLTFELPMRSWGAEIFNEKISFNLSF